MTRTWNLVQAYVSFVDFVSIHSGIEHCCKKRVLSRRRSMGSGHVVHCDSRRNKKVKRERRKEFSSVLKSRNSVVRKVVS
jgi:hypothetical protein